MTDTYVFLIREPDWDSDAVLRGDLDDDMTEVLAAHHAFEKAVADLGARVVGGQALQSARHGGVVRPGQGERAEADAVHTDSPYAETSELITGFYLVEVPDEDTARRVAARVPTGNVVEWRKAMPAGTVDETA